MATSTTVVQQERHIVVVGKTGCGKSTVANNILDDKVFPVQSNVSSVTGSTVHATAIMTRGGKEYKITMIDTVGLFDTGDNRSNKSIIDEVKKCIKNYAPSGLNLVLFVFKLNRYTPEEEKTFDYIIKNLRGTIDHVSALVITNCDGKSSAARQRIIDDFKASNKTAKIADLMKMGIYTVGFPDLDDLDEEDVSAARSKIERDKEVLIDLIERSTIKHLAEEIRNDSIWENMTEFCKIL